MKSRDLLLFIRYLPARRTEGREHDKALHNHPCGQKIEKHLFNRDIANGPTSDEGGIKKPDTLLNGYRVGAGQVSAQPKDNPGPRVPRVPEFSPTNQPLYSKYYYPGEEQEQIEPVSHSLLLPRNSSHQTLKANTSMVVSMVSRREKR